MPYANPLLLPPTIAPYPTIPYVGCHSLQRGQHYISWSEWLSQRVCFFCTNTIVVSSCGYPTTDTTTALRTYGSYGSFTSASCRGTTILYIVAYRVCVCVFVFSTNICMRHIIIIIVISFGIILIPVRTAIYGKIEYVLGLPELSTLSSDSGARTRETLLLEE